MRLLLLDKLLNFSKIKCHLNLITFISIKNLSKSAYICAMPVVHQFYICMWFLEDQETIPL